MASFENRAVVGGHFALVSCFVSLPRGAWELIYLTPLSFLFPMSKMEAPVAAAAETTGIPVEKQPLLFQLCLRRWRCSLPSSTSYSKARRGVDRHEQISNST